MSATYFRTSATGCATLHGEAWDDSELVPDSDGHNAIFRRAHEAQLDKFRERFEFYRPPSSDRRSFAAAAGGAT